MLYCPNCDLSIPMFPYASDMQLGDHVPQVENKSIDFSNIDLVLKQNYCPVILYVHNLINYQMGCAVTWKKLLSIVDVLVEHRSISHSAKSHVYFDHENLTHLNTVHYSTRVQLYRLLLEEFGCAVLQTPGDKKKLASALSRLQLKELYEEQENEESNRFRKVCEEKRCYLWHFPLLKSIKMIAKKIGKPR